VPQQKNITDDYTEHEDENVLETPLTEVVNITVDKGQESIRIDKYILSKVEGATRNKIQQAIEEELVLVNGKGIKSNYKIRPLDHIICYSKREPIDTEIVPENIPINIVFEDEDIIVLNKPHGMVVHPGSGNFRGTLVNAMAYYLQQSNVVVDELNRVGLVHRIDKDTSGLILFAKNTKALAHLAAQFREHTVKRKYVALVWGDPKEDKGRIEANIARNMRFRKLFEAFPETDHGKHAITHYSVIERFGYVSLINCVLETGRTHQIRVHMKYIGHTLFGDVTYGGNKVLKGTVYAKYKQFCENCFSILPRQALHAQTLGFMHPRTGEEMFFESELPEDLATVIERWRNYVSVKNIK
jgi:23S rRNA pseudouridine1911/1915/1917 synthase